MYSVYTYVANVYYSDRTFAVLKISLMVVVVVVVVYLHLFFPFHR